VAFEREDAMQLLMSLAALVAAATSDISSLSWLSGAWVQKGAEGRWAEEYWTPPRGHIMIGAGLSGRDKATRSFEHMRIVVDGEGRIAFYGMPGGAPAVAFALVRQEANLVVFENPAHDFPQRVSYRLDGKQLIATVSKIDGSGAESWTYDRPK
jgi:hypothetical protein